MKENSASSLIGFRLSGVEFARYGVQIPSMGLLGWDRLGALAEDGVALGAHTVSHPELTSLSPSAAEEEILDSAEQIRERTGVRPSSFTYP